MLEVLRATDALDASTQLLDYPDYPQAIQDTLGILGIRPMSVAQAEAIPKTVPGLKHVVRVPTQ